jgi:hypothetical protein
MSISSVISVRKKKCNKEMYEPDFQQVIHNLLYLLTDAWPVHAHEIASCTVLINFLNMCSSDLFILTIHIFLSGL